VRETVC
jgi:hypothetical protein